MKKESLNRCVLEFDCKNGVIKIEISQLPTDPRAFMPIGLHILETAILETMNRELPWTEGMRLSEIVDKARAHFNIKNTGTMSEAEYREKTEEIAPEGPSFMVSDKTLT